MKFNFFMMVNIDIVNIESEAIAKIFLRLLLIRKKVNVMVSFLLPIAVASK